MHWRTLTWRLNGMDLMKEGPHNATKGKKHFRTQVCHSLVTPKRILSETVTQEQRRQGQPGIVSSTTECCIVRPCLKNKKRA